MRVHDGAGSRDSSELTRWTNEVQGPDDWSNRSKHGAVKSEVEQAVVALLETRPCRAVILLRGLVLKGDRHTGPVWIRANECEERSAAVGCVELQIGDQTSGEIELSGRHESGHLVNARLLEPHFEKLWCCQHCVVANESAFE